MQRLRIQHLLRRALTMSTNATNANAQAPGLVHWVANVHPHTFSKDIQAAASAIEDARTTISQIQSFERFKQKFPLDEVTAYQASAYSCVKRYKHDETPVGRKLGFTNTNIWPEYNINKANWSYMYDTTVTDLEQEGSQIGDISFSDGLEPRIEPEIQFKIRQQPSSKMDEAKLLSCMEWVGHGFEIVQSVFPAWKFTSDYTTAAGALHGHLFIGPKIMLAPDTDWKMLVDQLNNVKVTLCRNDQKADVGQGTNVLGGPLKALKNLLELLDRQDVHPPLGPGEIVTTGTLTKALPMAKGETWKTELEGLDGLNGLRLTFT